MPFSTSHRGVAIAALFLSFLWATPAHALLQQQGDTSGDTDRGRITGTVFQATSAENNEEETLPGANVLLEGAARGTNTGPQGQYTIDNVEPGTYTLRVSFVGYTENTKKIEVQSGQTVTADFTMQAEPQSLEKVVVVGYGSSERENLTESVSTVSGEELEDVPTSSLGNALTGKVTGVQTIQGSGQPGGNDPTIYLRGVSSLTAGRSTPLFVVDGTVVRDATSFTRLDPGNIESISILKDAAATSVYGVEGANGVIIVETKRGQRGEMKVSASTNVGMQRPTHKQELADSYTYATLYNQAQLNDGVPESQLRFSDEAIEAFRTGSDPLIYPNVDWVDYLTKPSALQSRTNINVSGGTDDVRFFLAGGFMYEDGFFRTFDVGHDFNPNYRRYNLRANIDVDVTPTTKLSLTSSGRIGSRTRIRVFGANRFLWRKVYRTPPFASAGFVDGKLTGATERYIPGNRLNTLRQFAGNGYNEFVRNALNLNLSGRQQLDVITEGLSARIKGAYNVYFTQNKFRNSSSAEYLPFYRTDVDDEAAPGDSSIVYRKLGVNNELSYNESYGRDRDWAIEARLNYDRDFGNHSVKGLALYKQRKNYYPGGRFNGVPRGLVTTVGRINYGYDNRYLLNASVGYNGSENFAEDQRFGFFPSISGAWIATNESFMEDAGLLSYLKLRASYGLVGNDRGVGRFLYREDVYNATAPGYNFGNDVPQFQGGATEGALGNPGVTWATAAKQNYGVDFRLFDGKIDASFDYFREYRGDILTTRNTVPAHVAADLPSVNLGRVKNVGYEAQARWKQELGDFFVSIGANASFAQNEILYQDEVARNEPYLRRTGESVGQQFGYIFDSFFTQDEIAAIESGESDIPDHPFTPDAGDLQFKDLNDDGVVNADDQKPIGYPIYPEWTFGSNMTFRWKGFDASMTWAGATNVSRELHANPYRSPFGPRGQWSLMQWQAENYWTPERGEDAKLPSLSIADQRGRDTRDSDFWMRDASYIRLKNAQIGYTLDTDFLGVGLRDARIHVRGYNLLTFTGLDVIDPEQRANANNAQYPIMKTYTMGVRLRF